MKRFLLICLIVLFLCTIGTTGQVLAGDSWPDKKIRITICFGPGGSASMITHMLASLIEKELGQPVISENKPGGGGAVAAALAAKKKPDGYNFFTLNTSAGWITPHRTKVSYDPMKDFTVVSHIGAWQFGLAVKADSPFKTFQDLVDYAKAHPGEVTYSCSGVGTGGHLTMEWLANTLGISWKIIAYEGAAKALAAAMGGHVTVNAGTGEFAPQIKSGQMRLLAVFNDTRMKMFPDVPTLKELGYNFVVPNFLAIAAPAGLPKNISTKMDAAIAKAVKDPKFVALMDRIMVNNSYMSGPEFLPIYKEGYVEVGEIMAKAGLNKK